MDFANYWFSSGAGGGGYEIGNSLRFRGNQYLSKTFSSTGNRETNTLSLWCKRSYTSAQTDNNYTLVTADPNNNYDELGFTQNYGNTKSDEVWYRIQGGYYVIPNGLFRDQSAWMHIVFRRDGTQGTAANRLRMYINGVELGYRATNYQPQNQAWGKLCAAVQHRIGSYDNTYQYFRGYMAEIHLVDGSSLGPESFGEFNDDGVWVPKEVSGVTYGTNGFYLDFSDPSNIGADRSGNGNNFTATGFELTSTSSTSYDWMADSPTDNIPAWNPLYPDVDMNPVYSNANMRVTTQGFGTVLPTSGKWYWETKSITNYGLTGLIKNSAGGTSSSYYSEVRSYYENGNKYNGTVSSYGASWTTNDVIGVAVDADAGTITMYKNGSSQGTMFSDINLSTSPAGWRVFVAQMEANFGQKSFAHTPPAGFKPLSTAELPAVAITKPSEYFGVVTYTGNGQSTNAITGIGFQPDFVWIKNRTNANNHMLQDSVRGANVSSNSNTNGGESTNSSNGYVSSFNANGFTAAWAGANNGGDTNANGQPYVAWCWKRSIASGFDVVTWSGNNIKGRQISHNLGVQPGMIMLLHRTGPAYDHYVWHQSLNNSLSSDTWIRLNSSGAQETGAGNGPFSGSNNITQVTSSSFTVANEGNNSSATYVAYVWAPIPGFSSFGAYVGNSNTNGPYIYTGFRPAMVIAKVFSGGNDYWFMWDKARNPYNVTYRASAANRTDSEKTDSTDAAVDFLSNGFKLRTSGTNINGNNTRYLYMAFAEHPFGGANVSPSPAR